MKNTLIPTISTLALLAIPLSASLVINFDTDASGNPIAGANGVAGSYTGGGTVDANITTGVTNGGALRSINGIGDGDVLTVSDSTFDPELLSLSTTFNLGGGTGDLEFAKLGSRWKGWTIDNLTGATELTMTTVFDKPISGHFNKSLNSGGLPWGFSTALFTEGTGFTASDFDVTYTITDLYFLSDETDASSVSSTIPSTALSFTQGGWDTESLTSTALTFNSSDGFNGTAVSGDPNNLIVRALDHDGDGMDREDGHRTYATSFEVTIKPTAGATFANDTAFVFSYDGDRSLPLTATSVIPEPTSGLLAALAGLGLIARRKR